MPSKQAGKATIAAAWRIVVCSTSPEDKIAFSRCLLQELQSATVIVSEKAAGQRAAPRKGTFEVVEYTAATPQPPSDARNIVAIPHDLARPSRIADALASDGNQAQQVTVIDARTFLDDLEKEGKFPRCLIEASKKDERAHLVDLSPVQVLAEFIETADVIVLVHAGNSDTDELDMMQELLGELNPSATVARRTGDGAGDSKLLPLMGPKSPQPPPPKQRNGCWQAIVAARKQQDEDGAGMEDMEAASEEEGEEEEGGEEDEGDADGDDDDEDDEGSNEEEDEEEIGESDAESENDADSHSTGGWQAPVISRFTFFARRPFHPGRLHKVLKRGGLDGVIRSKGPIWVASHPEDSILWSQVWRSVTLSAPRLRHQLSTRSALPSGSARGPEWHLSWPPRACTGGPCYGVDGRRALAARLHACREALSRRAACRSEMGAHRRARRPAH